MSATLHAAPLAIPCTRAPWYPRFENSMRAASQIRSAMPERGGPTRRLARDPSIENGLTGQIDLDQASRYLLKGPGSDLRNTVWRTVSSEARTILHLDLDAFFASVEQLDDPSLRGRPVIVGGTGRRGVVCAASYEARRFGVRSAMPTARARRLCPGGVFLPPRFERYGGISEHVFGIYRRFTPLVEPLALDEAFLDVTHSRALHGPGRDIALSIKRAVREECGLAVSAGIADVKMAAKIACDLGKPDGLVEVPPGGVAAFLAPLPVSRLWGVGTVTEAALRRIGVQSIGDLQRLPGAALAPAVGASHARDLRALALGEDPREVVPDEAASSVGAEETFEED